MCVCVSTRFNGMAAAFFIQFFLGGGGVGGERGLNLFFTRTKCVHFGF